MRELLYLLFIVSFCLAEEETVDSGYENAEKYQPPQPPVSAKGGNQLGYVDETEDPYDQIFSHWEKAAKSGHYVKDAQNEMIVKQLGMIKHQWSQEMEDAPPGVQGDFVSTLSSLVPVISNIGNVATVIINIFTQMAVLWKAWQGSKAKSGVMKDTGAPVPDWQRALEVYNAAQDQQSRSPVDKITEQGFNEDGSPNPPQPLADFTAAEETVSDSSSEDQNHDFNDDGPPSQILENSGGANIINMLANQVGRARRF